MFDEPAGDVDRRTAGPLAGGHGVSGVGVVTPVSTASIYSGPLWSTAGASGACGAVAPATPWPSSLSLE